MRFANITRRADGSYVISSNGHAFHVPCRGEFADLWGEAHAYALAHPDQVTEEPESAPPTLEEARSEAVRAVKERSRRAETGGIRLNGRAVPTDRQSQAMLSGAVLGGLLHPDGLTHWQTGDLTPQGTPLFIVLSATELRLIGQAVQAHVQACFALREAKCAALAALDSPGEILAWLEDELETGWPGGGV